MKTLIRLIAVFSAVAMVIVGGIQAQTDTPRVWLTANSQQVAAGQTLTVNVQIDEAVGIYGSSFKIIYDSQALEVVPTDDGRAVAPGTFFGSQPSFTLVNSADANTGTIEYALTLTQPAEPVSGEGVMGVLTFRALKDAAVDLSMVETRLLSPEFTEVDGRKIARKINELQPQVTGLTVTVGGGAASVPDATLIPTADPTTVQQSAQEPAVITTSPSTLQPRMNPVLLMGGVLFILGLGLFAASLGVYIKMRRQFTLVDREVGLW